MNDTSERAMREAEEWLVSAKDKLLLAETDESASSVCCALSIHAIIRTNDALTLKFLNLKGTRHDDAPALFSRLLNQNKIADENRRFLRLLQRAMSDKSGADYGRQIFHYEDAKKYVDEAEEFVAVAKNCLKQG